MPRPLSLEFRRDVVTIARKGQVPLWQIAKDFGISESCLHRWLKLAGVEEGSRPGVTASESGGAAGAAQAERAPMQENEVLRR